MDDILSGVFFGGVERSVLAYWEYERVGFGGKWKVFGWSGEMFVTTRRKGEDGGDLAGRI